MRKGEPTANPGPDPVPTDDPGRNRDGRPEPWGGEGGAGDYKGGPVTSDPDHPRDTGKRR